MKLVGISSDRVSIFDIDNDGAEELVYTKLSNIIVEDLATGKIKRKIKIKPKAEKQKEEYELRRYRNISTETTIDFRDISSFAGDVVLKLVISDVDGDSKPELVVLRVDGILACYNLHGSEKWSMFLDPYISDIAIEDSGDIRVVAVSQYGYLYTVTADAKFFKKSLEELQGTPLYVESLSPSEDIYAILMREGILYVTKLEVVREKLKRIVRLSKVATINLPKHAEPSSMHALDLNEDGIKEIIVGFSDGSILIVNWKTGESCAKAGLSDKISRIFSLPKVEKPIAIVLDWFGNLALIQSADDIEIIEASPRKILMDIDGDSIEEEISIFTKNLRIKKAGKLINEIRGKSYISSYFVDDINNDGKSEIVVAWNSRTITVYSNSGRILDSAKTSAIPRSVLVRDIDGDNKKEIIVCSNDAVEVFRTT